MTFQLLGEYNVNGNGEILIILDWTNMGKSAKKRRKWPLILFLWVIFISLVAVVAYLSFQNGEDAKIMGKQFVDKLTETNYLQKGDSEEEMLTLTYLVRQFGRFFAFLLIGIVGTFTIHVSFSKCNWLLKTIIALTIITAIAFLTEKLKIYIPTRHYSYEEMMISIAATTLGFCFVSMLTLAVRAVKGVFHLMTASHAS